MGIKRKSTSGATSEKKSRKGKAKQVEPDTDEEVEQYAAQSTLVDPMIDQQPSGDSDDDDDDEDVPEFDGMDQDDDDDVPEFTGGENGAEEAAPAVATTSSSAPRKSLYKAPTLKELDEMRDAESKGGNTFSMQLDELLGSALLSATPAAGLKTLLGAVHDLVHSLPEIAPAAPKKALKKVPGVPFPGPKSLHPLTEEVQWKLGFEKPSEVLVAGSWPVVGGYKKAKGEEGNIDIVVMMPPSLFSAKDRTAYRYFHKRAYYLGVIAQALKAAAKEKGPLKGVSVAWEHADARRPIISVRAGKAQGLKRAVDVRIHAGAPDVFPLATLYPSKSLIRVDDEAVSTPQISTSLLLDTLHKPHLLHLHRLAQSLGDRGADKFLALWRIWAARRGLPRHLGGSGWFASMLLGWVVEGAEIGGSKPRRQRGLGKALPAWGALRAAWENLAHTDFEETPVFLGEANVPRTEFKGDVLVDSTGTVNLFAGWEKGDVEMLRYHARETLAMLEDTAAEHFQDVFLRAETLGPATYDEYMIVDASNAKADAGLVAEAEQPRAIDRLARRAADVVRQGLTDRARTVHTIVLSDTQFAVGLLLNGEEAGRILDVGPHADQQEACVAYRELWGEKSDMRRYQNGVIAESVVWSPHRPEQRAQIPFQAAEWLLKRHLGGVSVSSRSANDEWLQIVQVPDAARDAVCAANSETQGFAPIMAAYQKLHSVLKNIDDELPLGVLNVTPASELLRYASVFVPHPVDVNRLATAPESLGFVPVAEIALQFESSPRWPDDLEAVQALKLALLEKIARVLQPRMRARMSIALDAEASPVEDQASLELLTEGVAFRVRIMYEKEKLMIERALEPARPGVPKPPAPPRRLLAPALAKWERRFEHEPRHHSTLAPMHHRFSSFSTAARLMKRWAAAHMLCLEGEALELLVAHTYLTPGSLGAPAGATAGFLRTLEALAAWDWRSSPLFVPLVAVTRDAASASGRPRFPTEEREEALTAFSRRSEKHAWSIVTETDTTGVRWTGGVGPLIAGRVQALAGATLAAVRGADPLDVPALFVTPLEHYDAVLHLAAGTRAAQSLRPEIPAGFRSAETHDVRLGFDPASLLVADIQRLYGDALLVFHDVNGGRAIGILFNPQRITPRAFKPLLGYNSAPASKSLVTLNKPAIIEELKRLGAGIVASVDVRK